MHSDNISERTSEASRIHSADVAEQDPHCPAEDLRDLPRSDAHTSTSMPNILHHKKKTRHFQCKRCDWIAQGPRREVEATLVQHLRQSHGITAPRSTVSATNTQLTIGLPINTPPIMSDAATVLEQAICDFIVDTLQHFTLVATPSFRRMFEGRGVRLPTAGSVQKRIQHDLDAFYVSLRSELDTTCTKVSLSMSTLPRSAHTSLFVVCGCWITPDFQYRQRLFDVFELSASNSVSELMMAAVPAVVKTLNIEQKVLAVTSGASHDSPPSTPSDNERLEISNDVSHGTPNLASSMTAPAPPKRMRCIARVVDSIVRQIILSSKPLAHNNRNRTVQEGLQQADSINSLVKLDFLALCKFKKINTWHDWKTLYQQEILDSAGLGPETFYRILDDAVKKKNDSIHIFNDYSEEMKKLALLESDWSFLEQLRTVLKPFNDLTTYLARTQPTTICRSLGVYYRLAKLQDTASRNEEPFSTCDISITKVVQAALLKFVQHFKFNDDNITYFVAAILDPRIKGEYIKRYHNDGDAILARVRKYIRENYPPDDRPDPAEPAMWTEAWLLTRILQRIHGDRPPVSDIDSYFDSAIYPWNGRDDPEWVLKWWKMNADEYPVMSRVARDFLAVPAAEVRVERLFGEEFDVWESRESGLSMDDLRPLVLLKSQLGRATAA